MPKKRRCRKRKRRQQAYNQNLNGKSPESAKVSEFPIKQLTTANLSSLTLQEVNNCCKSNKSDCDVSMASDYVTTPLKIEKRNDLRTYKHRSNSSMAKLHSPGIEKVRLKSNSATQTFYSITETPRVDRDGLLDIDFDLLDKSLYRTPLRHLWSSNLTPIFDLKDLNRLRDNYEERVATCSRNVKEDSLKRLRKFNEVILNTAQNIDHDNCEVFKDNDFNLKGLDLKETSQMEMSFFTPQLYNGESASTPIHKSFLNKNCGFENPNLSFIKPPLISISTQVEQTKHFDVGLQTSPQVPLQASTTPKVRLKCNRRRSYRSMTPQASFYKIFPQPDITIRISPSRSIIMNRSKADVNEMCASVFDMIRKLHSNYSAKVPEKIFKFCSWLGFTIKQKLSSVCQVYVTNKTEKKEVNGLCHSKCQLYQISILKSGVDDLRNEVNRMEKDSKEGFSKFNVVDAELARLNQELAALRQEMNSIKGLKYTAASAAPPPPPPPIPPPPPPFPPANNNNAVSHNKTLKSSAKKKINESSRPIISLDDILKVKLKKIGDRPTPIHRIMEPQMSTLLQNVKLKSARSRGHTPSSSTTSSISSSSNSPCSSLTRMLNNVNTNEKFV